MSNKQGSVNGRVFCPVLQRGAGRALKGAEVHGILGPLPATSFLFLPNSPGSRIDLSSKLLGHGVAEETGNHPRDQAEWASSTLVTVSGTVVLESCRPPPPGVGSAVGCGDFPEGQEPGRGSFPPAGGSRSWQSLARVIWQQVLQRYTCRSLDPVISLLRIYPRGRRQICESPCICNPLQYAWKIPWTEDPGWL